MIPSRLPPSSRVGQPTIGRPFYGQAKGLLSPAGRQPFERSEVGLFSLGRSPVVRFSPPKAAFILAPIRAPTSPAGTVSQPIGKPFNGQAKGLLWLTWRSYAGPPQYYIPPEGESPEPVREASAGPGQNPWRPGPSGPAAASTLAAKPRQPSGIQLPAESLTKAHHLKCRTQQKSTNHNS